jgi:hypothetical protein
MTLGRRAVDVNNAQHRSACCYDLRINRVTRRHILGQTSARAPNLGPNNGPCHRVNAPDQRLWAAWQLIGGNQNRSVHVPAGLEASPTPVPRSRVVPSAS